MQSFISKHMARARRGFSLVELVIVIIIIAILAVAVFAGGSITVKKSQVSRTVSDLHNFSIAVEATLNERPEVANFSTNDYFDADDDAFIKALNANLPADYQLTHTFTTETNITNTAAAGCELFQSAKTDSWGNHYYMIIDRNERSADHATASEFYITVVSAGPNAITEFPGKTGTAGINLDDIFVLTEYKDGDVASVTVNEALAPDLPDNITNGEAGKAYGGANGAAPYIF